MAAQSVHLHEYGWFCPPGPSILGTLSSVVSLFVFPILVPCIVECLTLRNAKVTHLFLSSIVWHLALALLQVQSSSPAATLFQEHPRLCQLHMCFHLVWLYGSFFISTAFVDCHHFVLQGIDHRIWPFTTDPSHGSPHVFDNRNDRAHLCPHLPCDPPLVQ